MQRGRLLLLVAAGAALVSLLLPYFSAEVLGDVSAITANAGPAVAALVASGVVAVAGDRRETLGGLPAVAAALTVAVAVVLTGGMHIDARLADGDAMSIGVATSIGSGLWLMTAAAVTAVIGLIGAIRGRLS